MQAYYFQSVSEAGTFLNQEIQKDILHQINLKGEGLLILPGGNSIKLFFPYLLTLDVPWNKVTIGLSDERDVPLHHDMSNEKQLKESFLNYLPAPNYIPLNEKFLTKIKAFSPITILSMGIDGHLASLFPEEAPEWTQVGMRLYHTKKQIPNRISLSEEALLLSHKIYILALGKERQCLLDNIQNSYPCLNRIYNNSIFMSIDE
ncbi:MAG: 6-phosphogluconolactonase [Proteobacteria bacterium]|nr:6-phosphogluconolactonase [Pseudomonadota bacterium]